MITKERLTHPRQLEVESINILREVAAEFSNPVMMYYVGKDSSVMIHLAMKAFAEASADIYPRLAPTKEWDTAAYAIVRESGKMTYQFKNKEAVIYNKENLLNPWFIVKD